MSDPDGPRPDGSRPDPWSELRRFTSARIALGRAGGGLPTAEALRFALDHARARDAVRADLDGEAVEAEVAALGFATLRVASAAPDRATYLARPDLGRRLSDGSRVALSAADSSPEARVDGREAELGVQLAIVVADGLSAPAVARHAVPLLGAMRPWLAASGWRTPPVTIASQARVALGDEIGARLGARAVLVLIGERPGLSAPDSLGAYLTLAPRPGRTDAERNCLSNIRPEGLSYDLAAFRLAWLIEAAFSRGLSGIALKDESDRLVIEGAVPKPALPSPG